MKNSWFKSIFSKTSKEFWLFSSICLFGDISLKKKLDIFQYINKIQPISVVKIKSSEMVKIRQTVQNIETYGESSLLENMDPIKPFSENGGAIYIWLYRHDNPWLIQFQLQSTRWFINTSPQRGELASTRSQICENSYMDLHTHSGQKGN